jgi:hypothetical protein
MENKKITITFFIFIVLILCGFLVSAAGSMGTQTSQTNDLNFDKFEDIINIKSSSNSLGNSKSIDTETKIKKQGWFSKKYKVEHYIISKNGDFDKKNTKFEFDLEFNSDEITIQGTKIKAKLSCNQIPILYKISKDGLIPNNYIEVCDYQSVDYSPEKENFNIEISKVDKTNGKVKVELIPKTTKIFLDDQTAYIDPIVEEFTVSSWENGFFSQTMNVSNQLWIEDNAEIIFNFDEPSLDTWNDSTLYDSSYNGLNVDLEVPSLINDSCVFGTCLEFDGNNDRLSINDFDSLSFGNGTHDKAFSVSAWVYLEDATSFEIVNKHRDSNHAEYVFRTSGTDRLYFYLIDDSVLNTAGRYVNTPLTAYEGETILLTAFYDGSGSQDAFEIWLNDTRIDDTDYSNGNYIAMENTEATLDVGFKDDTVDTYSEGVIECLQIGEFTEHDLIHLNTTEWVGGLHSQTECNDTYENIHFTWNLDAYETTQIDSSRYYERDSGFGGVFEDSDSDPETTDETCLYGDSCLLWNGDNEIIIGDYSELYLNNSDNWTISYWTNIDSWGESERTTIWEQGNCSLIYWEGGSKLKLTNAEGSGEEISMNDTINLGEWHNLVFGANWNGTETIINAYLNGSQVIEDHIFSEGRMNCTGEAKITSTTDDYGLEGTLQCMRVGLREYSAPEISAIAADTECALGDTLITELPITENETLYGTIDGGNLTSMQFLNDGNTFNLSEVTGTPGLFQLFNISLEDWEVSLTDEGYKIISNAQYDGTHEVYLDLFNVTNGSEWIRTSINFTDSAELEYKEYFIPDEVIEDIITGNNKIVGRLFHEDPGNINHKFYIDYLGFKSAKVTSYSWSLSNILDFDIGNFWTDNGGFEFIGRRGVNINSVDPKLTSNFTYLLKINTEDTNTPFYARNTDLTISAYPQTGEGLFRVYSKNATINTEIFRYTEQNIADGESYCLGLSYDGELWKGYIDSVNVVNSTAITGEIPSVQKAYIGYYQGGGSYYIGDLDNFQIIPRILTDDEHQAYCNNNQSFVFHSNGNYTSEIFELTEPVSFGYMDFEYFNESLIQGMQVFTRSSADNISFSNWTQCGSGYSVVSSCNMSSPDNKYFQYGLGMFSSQTEEPWGIDQINITYGNPINLSIVSPNETAYNTDTILLNITYIENETLTTLYSIYLNGVLNVSNSTFTSALNLTLDDGNYRIVAYGENLVNNWYMDYFEFSVDTTPPAIVDVKIVSVDTDSGTIKIKTNENSNYTISMNGTLFNDGGFTKEAFIDVFGLVEDTKYIYNITLCDVSANCDILTGFEFYTLEDYSSNTSDDWMIAIMIGLVAIMCLALFAWRTFGAEYPFMKSIFLVVAMGVALFILNTMHIFIEGITTFNPALLDKIASLFTTLTTTGLILYIALIIYIVFLHLKDAFFKLKALLESMNKPGFETSKKRGI